MDRAAVRSAPRVRAPRSIAALIGPDPRVIADEIWAKLMWAGLNLTSGRSPQARATKAGNGAPWYPLELVRAVALLWLFAGLRVDEILRLRVGAIRWQTSRHDGRRRRAGCVCSTCRRTRPRPRSPSRSTGSSARRSTRGRPSGPRSRGSRIARPASWSTCCSPTAAPGSARSTSTGCSSRCCAARPASPARTSAGDHQPPRPGDDRDASSTTRRTRCRCSSCRPGSGTHHRSSTQHYARITPLTLTKAYTDAGYFARNVRTIEVLLDRDAITNGQAGNGGPFEFYDLGHGYCSYSFFEQCPHRMACARCDFYLPKPSSEAQLLEAKDGLQRMLGRDPAHRR